jgi:hypothetical protein
MLRPILIVFLTLFSFAVNAQSSIENDRIAELYELIPVKNQFFGFEVYIYDYKIKGKKIVEDSTIMARINIVDEQDLKSDFTYDTLNLVVTKYELIKNDRIPVMLIKHDSQMRVTEKVIVNQKMEELSKTFYKYDDQNLISEEAFTGYAYLDIPRKLSLITYKYESGSLIEKEKKYSLNGVHWIQTWSTKYDEKGHVVSLKETNDENSYFYKLQYDDKGQIEKYFITSGDDINSIKEVSYSQNGTPNSVYWYTQKKKKPLRLTKYYFLKK